MSISSSHQLSLITKLVVIKKMVFGVVMLAIAVMCLLGWFYYDAIAQFADSYLLNPEYEFVQWLMTHIADTPQQALFKIAELTGVYGLLVETTAVGLWLGMAWAEPLFILLVGALIPLEVWEVWHHPAPAKLLLFAINVFIVLFLTRQWLGELKIRREHQLVSPRQAIAKPE